MYYKVTFVALYLEQFDIFLLGDAHTGSGTP